MTPCSNKTCDRQSRTAYCSRVCQLCARNRDHKRGLPDIRIPLATWHNLKAAAELENLTVRELIEDIINTEYGNPNLLGDNQ